MGMGLTGCRRSRGPTEHGGSPQARQCRAGSNAPAARSRGLLSAQERPPRIVLVCAPFPPSQPAAACALGARAWRRIRQGPTRGRGSPCLVRSTPSFFLADLAAQRAPQSPPIHASAARPFFLLLSARARAARLSVFAPSAVDAVLANRFSCSRSLLGHLRPCLTSSRPGLTLPSRLPCPWGARWRCRAGRVWGGGRVAGRRGTVAAPCRCDRWERAALPVVQRSKRMSARVAPVSGQPRRLGIPHRAPQPPSRAPAKAPARLPRRADEAPSQHVTAPRSCWPPDRPARHAATPLWPPPLAGMRASGPTGCDANLASAYTASASNKGTAPYGAAAAEPRVLRALLWRGLPWIRTHPDSTAAEPRSLPWRDAPTRGMAAAGQHDDVRGPDARQ